MSGANEVLENVKEYYGKVLKSSDDLQTQACVAPGRALNQYVREAVSSVHPEVSARYYGCGLVLPELVSGTKILDLGSGSGRDCFALSKLVGESGKIVGIDMTDEQIEVANQYITYHTEKFGYKTPNVEYVKGFIENLTGAGLAENYFDIIVSNCVVNLSPDKLAVLSEAHKVLKEGGELYFSDVYTDTCLSDDVRKHKVLWGECISGALQWGQFNKLAEKVGFSKPYIVSVSPIPIDRDDFKDILGNAKFCAVTYRLFKLPQDCKQYKSAQVIYKGEIPGHENEMMFDHETKLTAEGVNCLSGDKLTCLKYSRFESQFEFPPNMEISCCAGAWVPENPFEVLAAKQKSGENVSSACCGPSDKLCC